jgi:hypothetical protein
MPPRYRTNLRVFRHREWIIRSRCRSAAARAPISRWRDSRVGRCGSASCLGVLYCAGLPLEWRICAAAPGSSRVAGDRRCHQSLSFGEGQGSLRYEAPMGACSLKNADEAALHIRRRDPLDKRVMLPSLAFGGSAAGCSVRKPAMSRCPSHSSARQGDSVSNCARF